MRCLECEHMRIVSIEDGCGASAKCFKTSAKGKQITWAMTRISSNGWEKEEGSDRVVKALKAKKIAPSWCPFRK